MGERCSGRPAGPGMMRGIEEYYVNMPVSEVLQVTEFSPGEYRALSAAGVIRISVREQFFRGADISYAGILWRPLIGSMNGIIYRVVAQAAVHDDRVSAGVFHAVSGLFARAMGEPEAENGESAYWRAEDGNVILERTVSNGRYFVQCCFTSGLILRAIPVAETRAARP